MNERIQKLADEAEKYADANFKGEPFWSEAYESKFAELIVAECLGIVDDAERGGSNDIWDNAVKFIRRDLQEHFGVEE
jgi:hypothetical protein